MKAYFEKKGGFVERIKLVSENNQDRAKINALFAQFGKEEQLEFYAHSNLQDSPPNAEYLYIDVHFRKKTNSAS